MSILRVNNILKYFRNSNGNILNVLDCISFNLNANEFLSIVGPTGCGKTTLLNIISGIESFDKGSFSFDEKTKITLAYLFQRDALFPWKTVYENIAFPLNIRKIEKSIIDEKVHYWINLLDLSLFSKYYPSQLSQGMRKKVALGAAMVYEPNIILMDEPFSALDAQTKNRLQQELLNIWESRKIAVLFVTHDISEAIFLSDRILTMTSRPAKVKREYIVDIPRHRDFLDILNKPGFGKLYRDTWNDLTIELDKSNASD
jgi:NitT/TauT family transport system ATP-binding protein